MRKLYIFTILTLLVLLMLAPCISANMAAPSATDIGSAVTFEKNDDISVLSEVLDIVVTGSTADIKAVYRMKNTADSAVTTSSMFLSPNIQYSKTEVIVNGSPVEYSHDSYKLSYSTEVKTDDWRYAVLTDETEAYDERTVDAVTFEMSFEPGQEYDVSVSYTYSLGGYPSYDFNVKRGEIEYYLSPAAMWKDFSSLTINLTLDEGMPVLKNSNLPFEKTEGRKYVYTSDKLPEGNLVIRLDENAWQELIGTFKSPYFAMNMMIILPFILIILGIAAVIVVIIVVRRKKRKKQNAESGEAKV